jgi:hypothetical protein
VRLAALALPILAAACGGGADEATDRQAVELGCQQRLVAALQGQVPRRGISPMFEGARARFAALSPEGCSEHQRTTAASMARLTGRIAEISGRLGDNPMERRLSPEENMQFGELQASVEQFEARRRRLIEDLREMEAREH